jgi:PAS domain-containing protein
MENTSYKIRIPKTARPIGHLSTAPMVEKPTYKQLEAKIKKLEADIEQRIQTEKDLQALGEKHKLIFEKASEAIFIIQDGVIKFANRRTRGVLGYTNEELKTFLISEIF